MAHYKAIKNSDVSSKTSRLQTKNFSLNNIQIEVRSKLDPYIAFTKAEESLGRDLSILFWVSVLCVLISACLIIALAVVFVT